MVGVQLSSLVRALQSTHNLPSSLVSVTTLWTVTMGVGYMRLMPFDILFLSGSPFLEITPTLHTVVTLEGFNPVKFSLSLILG